MTRAVEARALDVGYGNSGVKVIAGLDLAIEAGTFLSILGPSGCGKSTFLRVVADLLEPLRGSIKVLGDDPKIVRSRRDVGFVFQDSTLLPWRSVRDRPDCGSGNSSRWRSIAPARNDSAFTRRVR